MNRSIYNDPFHFRFRPSNHRKWLVLLCAAGFALACAQSARAANQTWSGGSVTDGNWSDIADWSGGAAPGSTSVTTSADIATFNAAIANGWGSPATPIVIDQTTQDIGGINFDTAAGNYFVGSTGGNSLLLTSGGTIQILSTLTATNAVETINAPLVIEGAGGTYTFANNSASGTGAEAGTLDLGGQISGGAAGATVLNLSGSNTNANTISGNIVNGSATSVAVTKSGAGTWVLSGANTYTGATTVSAGTLRLTGSLASPSLAMGGGTFSYSAPSGTATQSFTTTTINGGGQSAINLTVSGDTLSLGALTQTAGSGGSVNLSTGTGTITTTTANTNGILGAWATVGNSGAAGATATWATNSNGTGPGNVVAYAGYTSLSASTGTSYTNAQLSSTANYLSGISNGNTNGANNVTVLTGTGTATINSLTMQGDFSIDSAQTLVLGSGGLVLNGISRWLTNNNSGSTTGTAQLTTGLASGELFVDVPDATSDANNWRIWPTIANNGSTPTVLVKNGPGFVLLENANTYTGGTIINAGTLAVTSNANLGSTTTTPVTLNGGTLDAINGITNTHPVTVAANGGTIYVSSTNTGNYQYYFHTTNTLLGSGPLTVTGAGTLTASLGNLRFDATNTYSGNLTVTSGGIFEYGAAGAVSSGATFTIGNQGEVACQGGATTLPNNITVTGGTNGYLSFENGNAAVYSGNITLNANLTVGLRDWYNYGTGRSGTISGPISGTGGLATNPGTATGVTLTLTGADTYTGATTIASGTTLSLGSGSTTGSISTSSAITDSGTLTINRSNAAAQGTDFNGAALTGSGGFTQSGSGVTTLNVTNTFTGATTLTAGELSVSNPAYLGGATANNNLVFSGGTLQITGTTMTSFGSHTPTFTAADTVGIDIANAANNFTISQVLNQTTGGLTKLGAGTLTLTAANTYTGATNLNVGTLNVASTSGLGATGSTTNLNTSSAVLELSTDTGFGGSNPVYNIGLTNTQQTSGTIVLNRATPSASNSITHNFGTLTLSENGGLEQTLNVTKGTSGTSALDTIAFASLVGGNNNTVTEMLNPTGGNISIGTVSSFSTNASTVTFDLDGTTAGNAITGVISGGTEPVAITKSNTSTWTLSGANTYTGATTVSGGVLALTGAASITTSTTAGIFVGTSASGGAIYQSGTSTVTDNNTGGGFAIGTAAGAVGYYNLSGGTVNLAGEIDVGGGGGGAGTLAQFDMSGGTLNLSNVSNGSESYFLPDRGAAGERSVTNFLGGTVQIAGGATPTNGAFNGLAVGLSTVGSLTSTITFAGTAQFLTPSLTVKLNDTNFGGSSNNTNVSALNMDGGTLQTLGFGTAVNSGGGNGSAVINFNGGTIKAGNAGNTSFLSGLSSVNVYSGNGTIDNNGQSITIGQAILAASGTGVASIPLSSAGTGYFTPPQVVFSGGTISGGSASGATGYATVNSTTGAVTGIVITNPGTYSLTSGLTVALSGGGTGTGASLGAISLNSGNTSGGLLFQGSGTTTLTAANTFTGGLTIATGTTVVAGASPGQTGTLGQGPVTIDSGATLQSNSGDSLGYFSGAPTVIDILGGTITTGTGAFRTTLPNLAMTGGLVTAPAGNTGDTSGVFSFNSGATLTTNAASSVATISAPTFGMQGPIVFTVARGTVIGDDLLVSSVLQNVTYGGAVGGVTKAGTGVMELSATETYSGATTINTGTLLLSGSVNNSSGISINGSGAKLVVTGAAAVSPTVTLTNGTLDGTGTVNTVHVGSATGGVVTDGNGGTSPLTIGTLSFTGNATVTANVSSATTPGISTTSLATPASGTIIVNANNASWSNSTIYDLIGYSSISGPGLSSFATGTISNLGVRQSASLVNTGSDIGLNIQGTSPYWTGAQNGNWTTNTVGGASNWQLEPEPTYTTTDFLTGDTVVFDDTASGTTAINISDASVNPTSTTFNNSSLNYTVSSANGYGIASGLLIKSGSASVTINTANTYSGGTQLNAGTLFAGNAAALGTGTLTITGGTLDNSTGGPLNLANNIAQAWNGNFSFGGTNNLNLGTGAVTLGNNIVVTLNGVGTLTVGGVVGGSHSLTTGAGSTGTLLLNGADQYTGGTIVGGGTLRVGSATALGPATNSLTVNAGTLDLNGNSLSIGTLNGTGGTITNNSSSANVSLTTTSATSSNYAGALSDGSNGKTLALTNSGSGILTLSGSNAYSGGTNINAGELSLGSSGALGSSGTISFGGGSLQFTAANTSDYSSRFSSAASQAYSIDTNGQPVSLANGLSSSGGTLSVFGGGTLTLAGANTYTGATTVSGATLKVSGSLTSTAATMTVGNVAGNAIFNVTGSDSQNNFNIGAVSGAVGAVYLSGSGSVAAVQVASGSDFQIGNAVGAFGYVNVGAGTTLATNELGVGGEAAAGNALVDVNGTVNDGGWVVMSRTGAAQTGVLNVFNGGAVTFAGGGFFMNWGSGQTSIVNVQGGSIKTTNNLGFNLNDSNNATNVGILNLNGGVVQPSNVFAPANGTAILDFNGGTLKANSASATFISTPVKAYVYSGGGTIDNNGLAITIPDAILAPTGNGVSGIGSFTAGTGYITPPIVTIARGAADTTGVGATAIASINQSTGQVTGITITDPGTGYTQAPTFTLTGGGASSPATVTGAAPTPDVSGGITFTDSSATAATTSLTGANTYTGTTTFAGGTVNASVADSPGVSGPFGNGGNLTFTGGTLQYSAANQQDYSSRIAGSTSAISIDTNSQTVAFNSPSASSNVGGLTKLGAGTLTLNAANTFSGNTSVNVGTLAMGSSGALYGTAPAGNLSVAAGATFDLEGTTQNVGGLNGLGGSVANNATGTAGNLTVGSGNASGTFGGIIANNTNAGTGTMSLTKTGSGVQTLDNFNTYSGATVISGGTLRLASAAALAYTFTSGSAVNSGTITGVTTTLGSTAPTFSATGGPVAGLGTATFAGGSNSYIDIQAASLPNLGGSSNYTIATWIETTTAGSAFLYKGDLGWNNEDEKFYLTSGTGTGAGGTGGHAGGVQFAGGWVGGSTNVNNGQWNFIAISRSGGVSTVYVNGVADGTSNAMNLSEQGTQDIRIGWAPVSDGALPLVGSLSGLSVYTSALTSAQINSIMANAPGILPATTALQLTNAGAAMDLNGINQIVASLAGVAGSNVYLGGAMLTVNGSANTAFAGAISDTGGANSGTGGSLNMSGTGILTLAGASTYSGGTTVSSGTLRVANGSSGSATGTGAVLVSSGGTLGVTTAGGSGTIAPTGTNTVTIASGGILAGANGATLTLSNGLTFQSGAITSANLSGTPNGNGGSNPLFAVTGGSLNAASVADTINLTGTPSYGTYDLINYSGATASATGGFVVGTAPGGFAYQLMLNPGNNSQLDLVVVAASLTWTGVNGDAVTSNSSWDTTSTSTNWSGGSPLVASQYADSAAVTFADKNPLTNSNVANSTVSIQAIGVNPASVTFTNNTVTYTINNLSGSIGLAGSTGISMTGNGTVNLAGANSFTGPVSIGSGIINISNNAALGNSNGVTLSGGVLQMQGGIATTNAVPLTFNGPDVSTGALNNVSGANTYTGPITLNVPSTIGSTLGTLTLSGGVNNNGNLLAVSGAGNTTVSTAAISGAGGLTYSGSGTLNLAVGSSYGGTTTINSGTLRVTNGLSNSATGANSVSISSGATLGGSGTIGGPVSVAGGGILAPSVGLSPTSATTSNFGGGLTLGTGSVLDFNLSNTADGVGLSLLNDHIAVTGSLSLSGGTLNINDYNGTLATGTYDLINYTSGSLPSASGWTVNGPAGYGLTVSTTTNANQFDLLVTTASSSETWTSNGTDSNSMQYGNSLNWTPQQVPNAAGQVATFGAGSQSSVLIGSAFTIGQLNFNNGGNSGAPTNYLLAGSGSLTLNNTGAGASVNVSGGGLNPGLGGMLTLTLADSSLTTTFKIGGGSSLDVAGPINQSGGAQQVVLIGGGTLSLDNGTNTYSGGTTVNSGALIVDPTMGTAPLGSGPLAVNGPSSVVNVNDSATVGSLSASGGGQLNVAGSMTLTVNQSTSSTFNGTLGLNGGLVLANASGNTLTVSGAPTLGSSSSITVNSGTLALTNNTANSANVSGAPTASVAIGATLQLAGSSNVLSSAVNITTHGSGLANDGALTVVGAATQTVGVVTGDALAGSVTTYSGNTTVGDGTNAANLTATQILQNTLTINAGSTVTIAPSGSGIPADAIAETRGEVATSAATADSDSTSDPFTAIQAAIASGSISSAKGQQLENRIAAIERLAATDPGLNVSLLEDRVLSALPSTSVWSSSESSPLLDSGSGLLAADNGTVASSSGSTMDSTAAFAPSAAFGGSSAAVPEPSTLLLAALGGFGLALVARRRVIRWSR